MEREQNIKECLDLFQQEKERFKMFSEQVKIFFTENKKFNSGPLPIVHSTKSRVKDFLHLKDKLNRKWDNGEVINTGNFFQKITDIGGVRVLHLYQEQFIYLHTQIMDNINMYKEWELFETPKAYIWDKEKEDFYKSLGMDVQTKDSNYTSIHYVIKPNKDSFVTCEIQVRTLFEEVWGEIDHTINYPHKTESIACKEQIKVLAKLVNAGTRLTSSIFNSHEEYKKDH